MNEFQFGLVAGLVAAVVFHWIWEHYSDAVSDRRAPSEPLEVRHHTTDTPAHVMQVAAEAFFRRIFYFCLFLVALLVFLYVVWPEAAKQVLDLLSDFAIALWDFIQGIFSG